MITGDLLDVVRATALGALYLTVVGAAVRVLLGRFVTPVRGLGLTAGLGMGTTAAVVTLSYVIGGDAVAPVLPLLIVAGVVLLALAVWAVLPRVHAGGRAALRDLLPTRWDAVAVIATILIMGPLAVHGLTYWTALANDFPNYAGSAEVWIGNSGHGAVPFGEVHPDAFGHFQERRAGYEKPMATGVMVAFAQFTGTASYSLLAPVLIVSLAVFLAVLLPLVRQSVRLGDALTTLVVLVPTLSIVPLSRIQDAQIGHLISLALLITLVAVLVAPAREHTRGWLTLIGFALLTGMLAAATVGSNATLVLGTGLGTVGLLYWLVRHRGLRWRGVLLRTAAAAAVAIAMSLPLVSWYRVSLSHQTTGELGYDIPLASPFALIGMQTALRSTPSTGQAVLEWAAVLGIALAAYLGVKRVRPGAPASGVMVAASVANGLLIVGVNGFTSYATHKWMAVAVAMVLPFVLARFAELAARRAQAATLAGFGGLTIGATAIATVTSLAVPVVAPHSLLALADDSRVAGVDTLNIALGDQYQDSVAPLVVPNNRVISSAPTYSDGSAPIGDTFLLRQENLDGWSVTEATELGNGYVLAEVDLTLPEGTTVIDATEPASAGFLYGRWGTLTSPGVWATGDRTKIAFDVPDELRDQDLVLTLHGARYANEDHPRTVEVSTDGDVLARATFRDPFTPIDLDIPLSTGRVEASDGRVVLTLETPRPLSPSRFGSDDTRRLSYWLGSLTLTTAS